MGASGCGKTSLLRAVAGLWQSGSGTIKCFMRCKDNESNRGKELVAHGNCKAIEAETLAKDSLAQVRIKHDYLFSLSSSMLLLSCKAKADHGTVL
jgi:ABC-type transport system involved in cytochrome c biogenesis ATPase subunit